MHLDTARFSSDDQQEAYRAFECAKLARQEGGRLGVYVTPEVVVKRILDINRSQGISIAEAARLYVASLNIKDIEEMMD